MERYDQIYRLYRDYDTETLEAYQDFVDLFPPVDSRVALDHWEEATDERERRKAEIRDGFDEEGDVYAELAATLSRDQAFTALDLATEYERPVNALVLDVDETLRTAGRTDNEIPRDVLHRLHQLHEDGVPIVVCTGQTLENVKGFLIQGLGNELVHSGDLSIVYESGNGVFTPGHGPDTKRLLYEDLDDEITDVFAAVRSRIVTEAPDEIRRGCHLQGNEFNVTLKPNAETGTPAARDVIDHALVYVIDLLADAVGEQIGHGGESGESSEAETDPASWARALYSRDPEIEQVLRSRDALPDVDLDDAPADLAAILERIDVAYYEADAAEIVSLELDKAAGVEAAFDVLGVEDPFALVMGDSKSDLRVMRWLEEQEAGLAAAPKHASRDVLDHVIRTDELLFDEGDAASVLELVAGTNLFAELDG
ncbi:HAD family hydrolase [Halobacteria archaeon HArc-gm2]|nr:HAD family hydrolase [Halobacteria archaeon HArc-gm2]